MSSLLDQFNSQSGQVQATDPYPVMMSSVKASGYISMNQDVAQDPIFKKHKMNIEFPHSICHMAICNDQLVLIMANNAVYRMNLKDVQQSDGKEKNKIIFIIKKTRPTLTLSLFHSQKSPWTNTFQA